MKNANTTISINVPHSFAAHTEPFKQAISEEIFRAHHEYGFIEESEIVKYSIELTIGSLVPPPDLIEDWIREWAKCDFIETAQASSLADRIHEEIVKWRANHIK